MLSHHNDAKDIAEATKEEGAVSTAVKQRPVSTAFDYLEIFVYSAVAVILLFTFFIRLTNVVGPSMENTLIDGETLLVSNLFYEPKQGDIIVFHELGSYNEPIVKRVIATEGQEVDIDFDTWTVTVDGVVLEEDYRKLEGSKITSDLTYQLIVPENCLFVMGDNRYHSSDSRNSRMGQNGFIDERQVLGKVVLRLTPLNRFGTVD